MYTTIVIFILVKKMIFWNMGLLKPLCYKLSCGIEVSMKLQTKLIWGLISHHSTNQKSEVWSLFLTDDSAAIIFAQHIGSWSNSLDAGTRHYGHPQQKVCPQDPTKPLYRGLVSTWIWEHLQSQFCGYQPCHQKGNAIPSFHPINKRALPLLENISSRHSPMTMHFTFIVIFMQIR